MYNRQYLFTHTLTLSIIFYEYDSSRFKRLYRSGHNVAMLARLRVRVLFRPCANAVCLEQSHRQVDVAWAAIIIIMPRGITQIIATQPERFVIPSKIPRH